MRISEIKEPIFVLWKLVNRNGKDTKVPYQINNQPASSTNPKTWSTYKECKTILKASNGLYDGLGINLVNNLMCIDIDHIDKYEDRTELNNIIEDFNTYTEVSQSGKGLHILFYSKDYPAISNKNSNSGFEFYKAELKEDNTVDKGRFIAITENMWDNRHLTINEVNNDVITHWLSLKGNKTEYKTSVIKENTLTTGFSSTKMVLQKLLTDKNKDTFISLMNGELLNFASPSEARASLIFRIIFYTRDIEIIKEIVMMSKQEKYKFDERRQGMDFLDWEILRLLNKYDGSIYEDMRLKEINTITAITTQINKGEKLDNSLRNKAMIIFYKNLFYHLNVDNINTEKFSTDLKQMFLFINTLSQTPMTEKELSNLLSKGDEQLNDQ